MGVTVAEEIRQRQQRDRSNWITNILGPVSSLRGQGRSQLSINEPEERYRFAYEYPTTPFMLPEDEEEKGSMYVTTSRPIKEDFDPAVLERVRSFLRDALAGRSCRWPGYECPIVIDGVTHRTIAGTYYTKSGTTIYLGDDGSGSRPDWLPAALNGVIEWHCLQDEEDFSRKALQLFFNNVATQARSFQRNVAQAFDGQTVIEVAINTTTQQIIGRYEDDEEGHQVWRAAYSGEQIDPDSEENRGKYFPLRMEANFLISNMG